VAQFRASSGAFGEGRQRAIKPAAGWLCWQAAAKGSLGLNSLIRGKIQGSSVLLGVLQTAGVGFPFMSQLKRQNSLRSRTGNCLGKTRNFATNQEVCLLEAGNKLSGPPGPNPGLEATYTEHDSTTSENPENRSKSWARNYLNLQLQELLAATALT